MSLVAAKKRSTEIATVDTRSDRCAADRCPCRGTISGGGGGWLCAYHYSAQRDIWPRVTEALFEHEDIRLAIDEVLKFGDTEWILGKWEMMEKFFSDQPALQPSPSERNHRRWYEYRLRDWLMYLSGIASKRPVPRNALEPRKQRGNVAQYVAA